MNSGKEKSAIAAVANLKCPRCRQGKIFEYSGILGWLPGRFDKMNPTCESCSLRFQVEPGFFYGAMYVSYGFGVGAVAAVWIGLNFLANDPPLWIYMLAVAAVVLLSVPFSYRYARALYLFWFGGVSYDADAPEKFHKHRLHNHA